MRSNLFRTTLSALLAVALLAGLAALLAPASPPQALAAPAQAQAAPASANGFSLGGPFAPGDTSGLPAADSLADEPAGGLTAGSAERREMFMLPRLTDGWTSAPDGALQTSAAQTITPPYLTSFEGIQDTSGIQPPDTAGSAPTTTS
ncbi:MAG: hypothetical protein IPN59_13810 [Holophaga sp.]|nr:hypothetical protein [Holophaga sp.]